MELLTADLIDQYGDELRSCETQFQTYGSSPRFHGVIRTIQTLEDNLAIKRLLAEPGRGQVLVVDGGGSLRAALLGDQVAQGAQKCGWEGVVIYGAVRDTALLANLDLGLKALGSNPRRSAKLGTDRVDVAVSFGGVTFHPGEWLYSDEDGIVVSARPLH